MFTLLLVTLHVASAFDPVPYLMRYGYINEGAVEYNLSNALVLFQENYHLPVNGEPNNDTEVLMKTPRCGFTDVLNAEYRLYPRKWNRTEMYWHFYQGQPSDFEVAEAAFKLWEQHTNLRFMRHPIHYNILLSYKTHEHTFRDGTTKCHNSFDKEGMQLAHAFFPSSSNVSEIHISRHQPWYVGLRSQPPPTEQSLYWALAHEIGHALGIAHSTEEKSLMYPFAKSLTDIAILPDDDVQAIQQLYGEKKKEEELVEHVIPYNLCNVNNLKTFLVIEDRLYIYHNRYVWNIGFDEMPQFNGTNIHPTRLDDYLSFIPNNFKRLRGIYQSPSDNLIVLVDDTIYIVLMPQATLIRSQSLTSIGISQQDIINGVLNTYRGKSYIFVNNAIIIELHEHNGTLGLVRRIPFRSKYVSIPPNIHGAFRYINGNTFFFLNNIYFEYNEFTKTLLRSGTFDLDIFGFQCSKGITRDIDALISKLETIRDCKS